jgi:hypothetical protein
MGNGNGTFDAAVIYASGIKPYSVTVADVNADGIEDLLVPNFNGNFGAETTTISVFLGNSDGTFQNQSTFTTGGNAAYVVAADFDADGDIDLVVSGSWGQKWSYLPGTGNGAFPNRSDMPAAISVPLTLVSADFDGDGIPDLALGDKDGSILSIYK